MSTQRWRALVAVLFALAVVFLVAGVRAQPPTSAMSMHYSPICQMQYTDAVDPATGRPAYLVMSYPPSGGTVGDIDFDVGDLILRVGHYEILPGENLDTLIQMAVLTPEQYMIVRDVRTGQTLRMWF